MGLAVGPSHLPGELWLVLKTDARYQVRRKSSERRGRVGTAGNRARPPSSRWFRRIGSVELREKNNFHFWKSVHQMFVTNLDWFFCLAAKCL